MEGVDARYENWRRDHKERPKKSCRHRRSKLTALLGDDFGCSFLEFLAAENLSADGLEVRIRFSGGLSGNEAADHFLSFVKIDFLAFVQTGFDGAEVIAELANGSLSHNVMHFSITKGGGQLLHLAHWFGGARSCALRGRTVLAETLVEQHQRSRLTFSALPGDLAGFALAADEEKREGHLAVLAGDGLEAAGQEVFEGERAERHRDEALGKLDPAIRAGKARIRPDSFLRAELPPFLLHVNSGDGMRVFVNDLNGPCGDDAPFEWVKQEGHHQHGGQNDPDKTLQPRRHAVETEFWFGLRQEAAVRLRGRRRGAASRGSRYGARASHRMLILVARSKSEARGDAVDRWAGPFRR